MTYQAVYQGMYGASKFQIPAKANCQMIQMTFPLTDSHKVNQCLGWMVMTAIPGINYWHCGIHGGTKGSAFLGMPHCNDICIAAYHPGGISYRFSFCGTGLLSTSKAKGLSSKA